MISLWYVARHSHLRLMNSSCRAADGCWASVVGTPTEPAQVEDQLLPLRHPGRHQPVQGARSSLPYLCKYSSLGLEHFADTARAAATAASSDGGRPRYHRSPLPVCTVTQSSSQSPVFSTHSLVFSHSLQSQSSCTELK